jgi:hypothetical protein
MMYVCMYLCMYIYFIHDLRLHFVCPELLVAVCETSYGIQGQFIESHTIFTVYYYLLLSAVQRLNLFS